MQQHAPEAIDLGQETQATLDMYGIDQERTRDFGRRCLLARRLVERGVRFIQLYSGGSHNDANWDAHGDLVKNHNFHAGNTDQPIAGAADRPEAARPARRNADRVGRRVRPPADRRVRQGDRPRPQRLRLHDVDGRRRHQGGPPASATTDELGSAAVENPFHVKHLHATILHQIGLRSQPACPISTAGSIKSWSASSTSSRFGRSSDAVRRIRTRPFSKLLSPRGERAV